MPRQPRNIVAGEYYHLLARGNNKQKLFFEGRDFKSYLDALSRYKLKFGISIFHYCLMTNHVHLLVRSGLTDQAITKFMHALQTFYAIYFKKEHKSTGHVFENRFRHFHIDSESYLLECGRYIERNPVRAGMVRSPMEHLWSSYRFYAYGEASGTLTPNPLYGNLGMTKRERQNSYREYVETPRAYERIVDQFFDERVLI